MAVSTTIPAKYNYRAASDAILSSLRRDRDRQIVARRFGFDLPTRQTLEQIGKSFGITRERVRQIEKTTLAKIAAGELPQVIEAGRVIAALLEAQGGVAAIETIAGELGATSPAEQAYILFLATLAPEISVIDENDELRPGLTLAESYPKSKVTSVISALVEASTAAAKPQALSKLAQIIGWTDQTMALENLAGLSKQLAYYDGKWGLISWPEVNPKSIRDKTYLVLSKHGQPIHFSEIYNHIKTSDFARRDVTVQAVHNELIKDPRFILIGRGIYALAEWGYTPGTVSDIIVEVLRQESPLHKDEIVKRVLKHRQVKTTTIILNLQEKDHFVRVAKATYKLKDQ